jgi:hypothetical protein
MGSKIGLMVSVMLVVAMAIGVFPVVENTTTSQATSSSNGLTWAKEEGIRVDYGGVYDSVHAYNPVVVRLPDGRYRMYYCGNDGTYWRILSAVSSDGLTWTKEEGIRVDYGGVYDSQGAVSSDVFKSQDGRPKLFPDGRYRMYYQGSDGTHWRILSAIPAPPPPPPAEMVSYWKLDEGSGTIAKDSVDANHGTLVNGPIWTTGIVDGALSFDGVDDYVEVADSANLDITDAITIEAWIYPRSLPTYQWVGWKENRPLYTLFSKWYEWTVGRASYVLHLDSNGNLVGGLYSPAAEMDYLVGDTSLSVNTWHHIAFVYEGSNMKLYVDGNFDKSKATTITSIFASDELLTIGYQVYGGGIRYFDGIIDEAAIYNRALTPEEIQ